MSIPYLVGKSTHTHSPLGICQALASTCALSHVIPCGATLLVNMSDIEPRKEDDGFDGAFLSP